MVRPSSYLTLIRRRPLLGPLEATANGCTSFANLATCLCFYSCPLSSGTPTLASSPRDRSCPRIPGRSTASGPIFATVRLGGPLQAPLAQRVFPF